MSVTIIIVNFNTSDLLQNQLAVLAQTKHQIIVVDNASHDWPITLEKKYPIVIYNKNAFNCGFSFACNQGAQKATGEWLLFLNPDVSITKEQMRQLELYAEKNELDAVSPDFSDKNYRKSIPSIISLLIEFTPIGKIIPLSLFKTRTLVGGCLLVKKEVFMKLGGFDERFFMWFEDSDLTKRLVDAGYKIGFAPAKIGHSGGASFVNLDEQYKRDIFFNSMNIYAKKHFTPNGQQIVNYIKRRYTKRNLLPVVSQNTSIIIANMKRELLKSFLQTNYALFSENDEYIIVTSTIGESEIWSWRRQYPMIRFIPIGDNHGFAKTANIGFRAATGKMVGTVNDDTTLNKSWLDACRACFSERTGSVNPIIHRPDGTIESAGVRILKRGKAIPIVRHPEPRLLRGNLGSGSGSDDLPAGKAGMLKRGSPDSIGVQHNDTYSIVDATNGAAVLYQKEALNDVGLFDERFGSYLEDIDLSLRLKRAGYQNIVVGDAHVIHVGQQTSKSLGRTKNWLDFKNWIWVILKNWGMNELLASLPSILLERGRNLSGIIKAR